MLVLVDPVSAQILQSQHTAFVYNNRMPAEGDTPQPTLQPKIGALEAQILVQKQLELTAPAAYLLGRAAAGHFVIIETKQGDNEWGYTIEATGKKATWEGVWPAIMLDLPMAGESWHMPKPPSVAEIKQVAADQAAGNKPVGMSRILQATLGLRIAMTESGYINEVEPQSDAAEKLGRRAILPSALGVAAGIGTGVATRSEFGAVVGGLGTATLSWRALLFVYHNRRRRYAKSLEKNFLTPKGQAAAGEVRELLTDMLSVIRTEKTITPEQAAALLPYAVIFRCSKAWLKTPAAQEAFAQSPGWFRQSPDAARSPVDSLNEFVSFCIASAFEPGRAHKLDIPKSTEARNEATTQIFEALKNAADLLP